MADYTPVYGKPQAVTLTASGAIVGGNVLKFSDVNTVSAADANCATYAGVAAHDAASGAPITVYMGAGVIHETPAAAITTALTPLYAGSATAGELGVSNTGYNVAIGVAIRTTTTTHGVVRWKSLVG